MANDLFWNSEGKLKIVQLTDVHITDLDSDDRRTLALMRDILRAEQPDFVAITGDLVFGERNLELLPEALAPVAEAGCPWAYVFGNHDTEWGASKEALFQKAREIPGCRMEKGPVSGVGNYVLRLGEPGGKPDWALFFLDSQQYNSNPRVGGYGYIFPDQVAWYAREAEKLRTEGCPDALAFFHIALPEYNEVWDHYPCLGDKFEPVCCPKQNSGLFSAMLEAGQMRGVFVGHDHVNNYEGDLFGIKLCFGRGTGFHTYGREGYPRGARVIELSRGESGFRSWFRLEGGAVVSPGPLHAPEFPLE